MLVVMSMANKRKETKMKTEKYTKTYSLLGINQMYNGSWTGGNQWKITFYCLLNDDIANKNTN